MVGRAPLGCVAIFAALVGAAAAPVASATETAPPAISLSKSGPSYVNQGDTAEFTFYLYNSGGSDVSDVVVADDKCSPLSKPSGDDGDGVLNPGESWIYTCTYAPAGVPGDLVVNHATADGVAGGEVSLHADAYHSTWITALHLVKTVDKSTADPFDELQYTITVSNDGPPGFTYQGYLSDDGCVDLSSDSLSTDGPWFSIGSGESAVYTCHHNFDTASYTNEACAGASVYRDQIETARLTSTQSEYPLYVCDSATTTLAQHTVSGTIFEDMNADGARQLGEPPLPGVVVYADTNGNGARDEGEPNSMSDGQGNYSVNVPLGTSTIREEAPAGFTCSFPGGCSYNVELPKNSAPEPPVVLSRRTAARAVDPTGKDFGDWRPASVTGSVISDDNGNGARDSGEGTLAGIAVFADLDGNGILDQGEPATSSAADGTYTLGGLKPGSYTVRHVLVQDGRTCTAPPGGCKHDVTLTSGATAPNRDFLDSTPAQAVLGARIIPGVVRMTGATGCAWGSGFSARIRGRGILRVTFKLDGQNAKTLTPIRDNRWYRYRVNVRKLGIGIHTVSAAVTFRQNTVVRRKTIRLSFKKCVRQISAPRFTG